MKNLIVRSWRHLESHISLLKQSHQQAKSDTISEGVDSADAPDVSGSMNAYLKTLSAFKQS